MRASSYRRWSVVAVAFCSLACATNPAPRGWLAPAQEAQADPYGAWIVVSQSGGSSSGEFLAVDRDSVFILAMNSQVVAVSRTRVVQADVWFYDAKWGGLAGWTALGAVSTISNGYLLILTLPAWTIGGTIATAAHSRAPRRRVVRPDGWEVVRQHARFPAGLPPGLPRTLRTKPPR